MTGGIYQDVRRSSARRQRKGCTTRPRQMPGSTRFTPQAGQPRSQIGIRAARGSFQSTATEPGRWQTRGQSILKFVDGRAWSDFCGAKFSVGGPGAAGGDNCDSHPEPRDLNVGDLPADAAGSDRTARQGGRHIRAELEGGSK